MTRAQKLFGPACILLAAALAITPQLIRGDSCGHDFDFHLVSWIDALNSWRHGVFYPHWTPSPNYNAGEPRFVFYPPLTWMLGSLLAVFLPWSKVAIALTFLLLAATGFAVRALARLALDNGAATLAGCFAIFSGYTLFTAYERSAFAELSGGFWIPLILLLILRETPRLTPRPLWQRAFDGSTGALSLVIAGTWLSNAPLGVMGCYLLAGVSVILAASSKSWAPLIRGSVATLIGMGLAAFYLVPAADEQRWMDARQAIDDPGLLIQNSWLFARHADPHLQLHDVELFKVSVIATIMIALALVGGLILWRRRLLDANFNFWLPLLLIPLIVLLLQFPLSEPVWKLLPKLLFLQFPWRWLVVVEAPMAILTAAAIWPRSRTRKTLVIGASALAFVAICAFTSHVYFQACYPEDAPPAMLASYASGVGFEGTDEYEPPSADNSLVALNLPDTCFVSDPTITLGLPDPDEGADANPVWSTTQHSCGETFPLVHSEERPPAEHLRLHATLPHAGYLILRLRSYPAWSVHLNYHAVSLVSRDDGLMAVPVPAGAVDLAIDWTTTSDVRVGRELSLIAILLLAALAFIERRASLARLS